MATVGAAHGAEVPIPAGWIAGSALEQVARRLRVLGFDVESGGGARLEALVQRAGAQGRGVLTTSARRPRGASGVHILTVPRDPAAAVRLVDAHAVPASAPFVRCTACNHPLAAAATLSAVPADVRAAGHAVRECAGCGRHYWPGSHTDRLRRWLEAALQRPIPAP